MITHDLGITAEMADRVMVMYAGRIIEYGPVDEIYYRPHHPYTVGLLRSIPRMSSERGRNLYQINGNPPQLLHLPSGCSFEPRCECSLARCRTMSPGLKEVGDGHMSACFLDSPAPGERPEA
jgi:oligopeptide/dipeptide ABC transporter ATP-binding protein